MNNVRSLIPRPIGAAVSFTKGLAKIIQDYFILIHILPLRRQFGRSTLYRLGFFIVFPMFCWFLLLVVGVHKFGSLIFIWLLIYSIAFTGLVFYHMRTRNLTVTSTYPGDSYFEDWLVLRVHRENDPLRDFTFALGKTLAELGIPFFFGVITSWLGNPFGFVHIFGGFIMAYDNLCEFRYFKRELVRQIDAGLEASGVSENLKILKNNRNLRR